MNIYKYLNTNPYICKKERRFNQFHAWGAEIHYCTLPSLEKGVVDGMNSSAIHVPLVSCFYKITTEPRSEPTSPLNWKQNR